MTRLPLAFLEFFVVLAFGLGWLVLELVTRRLDKQRPNDPEPADKADPET